MTLIAVPIDQWTKATSRELYLFHEDQTDSTIYQGKRQDVFNLGNHDTWLTCNLTYVRNHGASWGIMAQLSDRYRRPVLITLGVILAVLLFQMALTLQKSGQTRAAVSLVVMVVGSFGNLIDRIRWGYVVDFVTLKAGFFGRTITLPTFNIADIIIVLGLFCLIINLMSKKPSAS